MAPLTLQCSDGGDKKGKFSEFHDVLLVWSPHKLGVGRLNFLKISKNRHTQCHLATGKFSTNWPYCVSRTRVFISAVHG
jgi:hypothetical protein